jgi:hypothetical protein
MSKNNLAPLPPFVPGRSIENSRWYMGNVMTFLVNSEQTDGAIFLLQIIPAVLLLLNRYVPLALTVLGPVIVNILFFHLFMAPAGLPLALLVATLWIVVFRGVRSAFAGLFQQQVQGTTQDVEPRLIAQLR